MFPHESGLSEKQVSELQAQYGNNILPEKPPPSDLSLLISQIKSPLVYILIIAGIITLFIGHFPDAFIIFLAVILNTFLGFIQERKASRALYALRRYVDNRITVIRGGKRVLIATSQIVPQDIVILTQGNKIPADGVLTYINRLHIDESLLTGESVAVQKIVGDKVFMGTTIAGGQAVMKVELIGAKTQMGQIALKIQEKEEDTPLQKQIKGFSHQLVVVVAVLIFAVFIIGMIHQFTAMEMFTTSVALAVSSIPEGLIVSLTVVLAIGMQRILARRGLVRKLSAAETLGGVTTICIDKTGTLTQGQMTVVDFVGDEKELAQQIVLANDMDDPIVIAGFEWGRNKISDAVSNYPRLDSIPFSSEERFFTSLHKWRNGNRIFVNGAPEIILKWCDLPQKEKQEIIKTIDNLTRQGKRVVGFARKDVSSSKKSLNSSNVKDGLSWVGILAFNDPVRSGVKEAIEVALSAGIGIVVITGDYPKTSEFVLSELGINLAKDETMTGDELKLLSVEELAQRVKTIRLFARTTPDQKLLIVEALKKHGEIVAMMGDGVNDAPALHRADIGIAVGEATDVAKESADLVLLDSKFSTIISAIEEGRSMFENIRKIILYIMCDAFAEILVVLGGIIVGLPLPISAIQILWVNLVSDGFPDLALTVDPKRIGIMKEKPRVLGERLVNKWMAILIGFISLTAGMLALVSFIVVYKTTGDLVLARSMAFVVLGLNSLVYVFSVRTLMTPFWKSSIFENRWLVVAVVAGFGLQILPFMSSSLRNVFGISNLSLVYWLIAVGLSAFMFVAVEIFKHVYKVAR